MIKVVKTIFFTLLFFVAVIFSIQNSMEKTGPLYLRFFGLETPPIDLYLLILFSILLGVLLAGVGFIFDERSLKKRLREKDQEIENLKREARAPMETGGFLSEPGEKD